MGEIEGLMDFWLRIAAPLSILGLGLTCAAWAAGGWLAARALFRLKPGEALAVGASTGFVLFLMGINLLTRLLNLPWAVVVSAGAILVAGIVSARRSGLGWSELRGDLKSWPQLALLVGFALLFAYVKRGINLFDDYMHMPLVSIMGAGDIPPHFYLNPAYGFAYHYGLQVFAASLEGLANFYPWAAWDLARGAATSFTLVLGWIWMRRFTRSGTAATLGSFLFVFGGGTRWLMDLLPSRVLEWASRSVQMTATGLAAGPSLVTALSRPFVIEGQGNMPFSFASMNGDFEPVFFNLANTGALQFLSILLLLLLFFSSPSIKRPAALAIFTLVFASLALSAEHLFALWWGAIALVLLLGPLLKRAARLHWTGIGRDELYAWLAILGLSALLSVVQGGYITEAFQSLLARLGGDLHSVSNSYSFALRWPPAIVNAHLGVLSPFNPAQLLVLLLEFGPVLLLAPVATVWAWKALRRGQYGQASLGLAALVSLVFTLFVAYGVDRSSTRFVGSSLWIWLALGFPIVAFVYRSLRPLWKTAVAAGYAAVMLSGLVIFGIELTSVPYPSPTYFISNLDAAFTQTYWNKLEPGAQVMDSVPERAVTIFGRAASIQSDIYIPLPEWGQMLTSPDPYRLRAYGFSYVYIARDYWDGLSLQAQQGLQAACVKTVQEMWDPSGDYRKLLDIKGCQ
jgi:hypothetical protein